jgi:hypothetical protein
MTTPTKDSLILTLKGSYISLTEFTEAFTLLDRELNAPWHEDSGIKSNKCIAVLIIGYLTGRGSCAELLTPEEYAAHSTGQGGQFSSSCHPASAGHVH